MTTLLLNRNISIQMFTILVLIYCDLYCMYNTYMYTYCLYNIRHGNVFCKQLDSTHIRCTI